MKYAFKHGVFVRTAIWPEHYPRLLDESGRPLPEVAFAGRSNVGKSSLINHLLHQRNLAKASATPGKTQAINFFSVDDVLGLVDLPGYGFAQVPDKIKEQWGPMVQSYLNNRETLKLVLTLIDMRRLPDELDFQLMDWIISSGKAAILVLTKADKLTAREQKRQIEKILQAYGLKDLHHVAYSSTKNIGQRQLVGMINSALETP